MQMSDLGGLLAIRVAIALKEWIPDQALGLERARFDSYSARNHDGVDRNHRQWFGRIHARRVGVAQYPVRDRRKRSQS